MEQKKPTETHTVMPKKLAEALMESGMQHFAAGGVPQTESFGQHTMRGAGISDSSVFGQMGSQVDALQGMNLYNAQTPDITRQNFQPQIQGAQQAQGNIYQNQNRLASDLLAQSRGQGPNIAQTQLANATGQNVQQQGALMASQRGANSNPALLARQSAMQGSQIQQSAAGQSAALQAQQQIAAQQALSGVYQQQAGNALQSEQIQQQGQANQNSAINTGFLGAQTINANASGQNAQRTGNMQSSFTNALGGAFALSDGGLVPSLIPYQSLAVEDKGMGKNKKQSSSDSSMAEFGNGASGGRGGEGTAVGGGGGAMGIMPNYASGGSVNFGNYLAGGNVPGKSSVNGDSKENDTVPAMLSPGEVVIDKETLADKGPIGKAAKLVAKHIEAKNKGGDDEGSSAKAQEFMKHLKPQKKGYGGVIEARGAKKMSAGGVADYQAKGVGKDATVNRLNDYGSVGEKNDNSIGGDGDLGAVALRVGYAILNNKLGGDDTETMNYMKRKGKK